MLLLNKYRNVAISSPGITPFPFLYLNLIAVNPELSATWYYTVTG